MTLLRTNEAGVPQTGVTGEELSEANIAELLRAQMQQEENESGSSQRVQRPASEERPNQQEEDQPATGAAPNIEQIVRSTLAREVAPQFTALTQQLKALGDQVAFAARRGNEVPPEVYQAITTLSNRLEAQEMAAMTPEEQVVYLREKEQQQEEARRAAWQRQQTEAAQAAEQTRQQGQQTQTEAAQTAAQTQAVREREGTHFGQKVMPGLFEVAARYGISEEEARIDMIGRDGKGKAAGALIDAEPVLEGNRLIAYDWFKYGQDMEKAWAEKSEKRDGARSQRTTGATGRPGGGIPKGFDAWDKKYDHNVMGLLEEVVKASGSAR